MLGVKRRSQMDKVRTAVRDAVSYADEIVADERLRADVRAALGHGAEAGDRVRKDIAAGSIAERLVSDRKLRKKLRAVLDDLDSAGDRVRRKTSHRLRNTLLVVGSAGAVAAAIPNVRRWLATRTSQPDGVGDTGATL
jgi:hypothetical protein